MADKKEIIGEVLLRDVRLSFPALFQPQERESDDGSIRKVYKANFLIPKKGDANNNMAKIKKASDEVKAKKWGADPDNWPKLKPEKLCVRDGDLEDYDGFAGNYYLSASSPVDRKPQVITNRKDADGKWQKAEPGGERCPYAGCQVNALVRLWAQDDKKYGKRINASVEIVQFLKDGPAFGAGPVDANEKFTDDMVGSEGSIGDDGDDDDGGLI